MEQKLVMPTLNESSANYPIDVSISTKQFVTQQLNYWTSLLVERAGQLHESLARKKKYPTLVIKTQTGPMSITSICKNRKELVIEARERVEILRNMDQMTHEELETMWADENIVITDDFNGGQPEPAPEVESENK